MSDHSARLPTGGLPRFVAAKQPEPLEGKAPEQARAALDLFDADPAHAGAPAGGAVVLDVDGRLVLAPAAARGGLAPAVQEQLALRAVAGRPRRLFWLRRLHLLLVHRAEPGPDADGVDDPVWLHGVLTGPFALDGAPGILPAAVEGRLAVSRAELLEAAVRGAELWFPAVTAGRDGAARRVRHLLLAGGDAEAVAAGGGVVLAFPAGERPAGEGNEAETARLVYDVLAALRGDARRSGAGGSAAALRLPRRPGPGEPGAESPREAGGFWSKVAGAFVESLPPGGWDEVLAAARVALGSVPGWPSPLARSLRRLERVEEALWSGSARIGLEVVEPQGGGTVKEKEGALVVPWWSLASSEGKLLLRVGPEAGGGSAAADLEVEAEVLDDRGFVALCFRRAGRAGHAEAAAERLGGTKTWRTLRARCAGAAVDGSLWGAGDVGFRTVSEADVRFRRVAVRVLGASEPAPPPAAPPGYAEGAAGAGPVQALPPGRMPHPPGWLDRLGDCNVDLSVLRVDAARLAGARFEGWVFDAGRGSPEGRVELVLAGAAGETFAFPAAERVERGDVAKALQDSRGLRSGFAGAIGDAAVPPGYYALRLRLTPPDALSGAEHDTGRILHVATGDPARAAAGRAAATGHAADAVVYRDPRRNSCWVHNPDVAAEVLGAFGFAVLEAEALAEWMRAALARGPAGAVCVFAQDVAPDTVVEEVAATCLIRRYLDAGGSVVWAGDVPFYYLSVAGGGARTLGPGGQKGVLGLGPYVEREEAAGLTEAGRAAGLCAVGGGHRAQRAGEVDVVLSSVGEKHAEAWVKRFCPGHPRGGFTRFFAGGFDAMDARHLLSLRRLADPRRCAP